MKCVISKQNLSGITNLADGWYNYKQPCQLIFLQTDSILYFTEGKKQ